MEKLLAVLVMVRVESGQDTTPAPALLVFILATPDHSPDANLLYFRQTVHEHLRNLTIVSFLQFPPF